MRVCTLIIKNLKPIKNDKFKGSISSVWKNKHQTSCNRPCGPMGSRDRAVFLSPAIHTCHAPSLRCLLDLLLVIPSQLREPVHLDVRLPDGVAHLPEAGEVVPVWDLSVEHGRLKSQSREVREMLISVGTSPPCPQPRRPWGPSSHPCGLPGVRSCHTMAYKWMRNSFPLLTSSISLKVIS